MLLFSPFHFSSMVGGRPGSQRQDAWPALMLAGDAMWYSGPFGEIGDEQQDSLGSMCVAHNCMGVQGKNEGSVGMAPKETALSTK